MILYSVGFGFTIYSFIFPGREKWGYLAILIVGIPCWILLLADLVLRSMFLDKRINWIVQIIITFFLLILLSYYTGFWR